jgi:hypothetical protein
MNSRFAAACSRRAIPLLAGLALSLSGRFAPLRAQAPTAPQFRDSSVPSANDTSPAASDSTADTSTQASTGFESTQPAYQLDSNGLERLHALPADAYGETPPGIPYSSVLNTTGADVNDIDVLGGRPFNTNFNEPSKLGNAEGAVDIQPFGADLSFPFVQRKSEPEDANIKAGPFYVKFHYMDAIGLHSDNFNRTESGRQSETLLLLRLNLSIIAQLTDTLQFAVTGSIDYLPLNNQVGIETSLFSNLGLLASGPLFATQFVYDCNIAGWPVTFADDFRVHSGIYGDSARDDFDLFNGDYLARDRSGRYTFRSGNTNLRDNGLNGNSQTDSLIYFQNTISALTNRLLPGDVRLTVRARHDNFWYNQSNRGLPSSRDDFYTALVSERDNMRFKPFVSYEATHIEGVPGVGQTALAGIFGPIDDYVFIRANVGYYVFNSHNDVLYQLLLDHTAGEYTTEHLAIERVVSDLAGELRTSEYYRLDQTLGPTLLGTLFLAHSDVQELVSSSIGNHDDYIGGLQLVWYLGSKTTLRTAGIYNKQTFPDGRRDTTMTGRLVLDRRLTDSLTLQLLYQYQHAVSNESGNKYYENLVYLRLVQLLE